MAAPGFDIEALQDSNFGRSVICSGYLANRACRLQLIASAKCPADADTFVSDWLTQELAESPTTSTVALEKLRGNLGKHGER